MPWLLPTSPFPFPSKTSCFMPQYYQVWGKVPEYITHFQCLPAFAQGPVPGTPLPPFGILTPPRLWVAWSAGSKESSRLGGLIVAVQTTRHCCCHPSLSESDSRPLGKVGWSIFLNPLEQGCSK